jgi:hypothetical protein
LLEKTARRGLIALRGEQEVDCVIVAIDSTVEIRPYCDRAEQRDRAGTAGRFDFTEFTNLTKRQ